MDKKILAAIVIVILAVAIAGTYYATSLMNAPAQQETITLTVMSEYVSGSIKDSFEAMLNAFMQKYPYINVRHSPMDQTTYNTVMPIWLASGRAPDLFMWFGGARTQEFVNAGYLANISDIFGSIKDDFSLGMQNTIMSYNGAPYAVALDSLVYGVFYNKDIFSAYNIQVPTTWADFLAACQTIQQGSNGAIAPYVIAARFPWLADEALTSIMSRTVSGDFMRQLVNGQANWTDPKAVECLQHFSELMPYLYSGSTELTDYDASAAFARGTVAMEIIGPWREGMVHDINASENLGWFPTPSINSAYDHQLAAHSDVMVISKDTKNKKEADLLMQYLASPAAQQIFGTGANDPVPNLKVPSSAYNGTMVQIINSQTGATDIVMEIGLMTLNDGVRTDFRTTLQKLITGQENYTQVAQEISTLPWGQPNS